MQELKRTFLIFNYQNLITTTPVSKQGNYSSSCPLNRGFYVMGNIHLSNLHPALEFMFRILTVFEPSV
ncbi:hypothetical protein FF38_07016 [Lucilia cuprina]|uniref:Uncharacterized protein n=1 Tax=Lucilia cuprina TaxID=7375 RepID=A0A0L0CCJ3_LUCCU|nr:hypothetical protein FF38_07016 [Lucilia cuprina]